MVLVGWLWRDHLYLQIYNLNVRAILPIRWWMLEKKNKTTCIYIYVPCFDHRYCLIKRMVTSLFSAICNEYSECVWVCDLKFCRKPKTAAKYADKMFYCLIVQRSNSKIEVIHLDSVAFSWKKNVIPFFLIIFNCHALERSFLLMNYLLLSSFSDCRQFMSFKIILCSSFNVHTLASFSPNNKADKFG